MSDLRELSNIGAQLAGELSSAGITTSEQLMESGSLNAAASLQSHGFSVCNSKLYALEGAVRGVRWHQIPSEERATLWESFLEQEDRTLD